MIFEQRRNMGTASTSTAWNFYNTANFMHSIRIATELFDNKLDYHWNKVLQKCKHNCKSRKEDWLLGTNTKFYSKASFLLYKLSSIIQTFLWMSIRNTKNCACHRETYSFQDNVSLLKSSNFTAAVWIFGISRSSLQFVAILVLSVNLKFGMWKYHDKRG